MIASAPVCRSTSSACSGVETSPLAMTGMRTAALTARIVSYSTGPTKAQARVRPCTARARMPASSAIRAIASAFLCSGSLPVRILSVTGTSTARTTAVTIASTSGSFASSAEPAATLQTFLAGQPMLMSMICAPRSTLYRAASAISPRIGAGDLHRDRFHLAAMIGSALRFLRAPKARIRCDHLRTPRSPRPAACTIGETGDR